MSIVQENINKMFEEKEKQEQLASTIVEQKNNQFEQILKEQIFKQNEEIKQQEIAYMNSLYYQNYQMILNSLGQNVTAIYYEMLQKYQSNIIIFKYSYHDEIKSQKIISGIGYPVPDKFLKQIKKVVENTLEQISVIEDGEFTVDIVPAKYIQEKDNNVMKKVDSYILEVSLNKKMDKNKIK